MMNERLIFILLLCVIVVLWRIIGYWRKRAGESAFTAAQMTDKTEEHDRFMPFGGKSWSSGYLSYVLLFTSGFIQRTATTQTIQFARHKSGILWAILSIPVQTVSQR